MRLFAVGENFLFSSLALQLGRRKGVSFNGTCGSPRLNPIATCISLTHILSANDNSYNGNPTSERKKKLLQVLRYARDRKADPVQGTNMFLLRRATGEPLGSDPTNRPDKRSLLQSSTSTCSSHLSCLVFFTEHVFRSTQLIIKQKIRELCDIDPRGRYGN